MANFPWIFQDGGIRAVTSCQLAFQHNAGKKVGLGNICFQLVLEHIFLKKILHLKFLLNLFCINIAFIVAVSKFSLTFPKPSPLT